jgi:hypothetical protein
MNARVPRACFVGSCIPVYDRVLIANRDRWRDKATVRCARARRADRRSAVRVARLTAEQLDDLRGARILDIEGVRQPTHATKRCGGPD